MNDVDAMFDEADRLDGFRIEVARLRGLLADAQQAAQLAQARVALLTGENHALRAEIARLSATAASTGEDTRGAA